MNFPLHQPADEPPRTLPLTARSFLALAGSGALDEIEGRIELISGTMTIAPPPGGSHQRAERKLLAAVFEALFRHSAQERLAVQTSGGLELDRETLVSPDLMVVSHRDHDGVWQPGDVVLLVEVAQSSLSLDLGNKADLYAAAGIQDYWVMAVDAQEIVIHRNPHEGRYRTTLTLSATEQATALLEPALSFAVAGLF